MGWGKKGFGKNESPKELTSLNNSGKGKKGRAGTGAAGDRSKPRTVKKGKNVGKPLKRTKEAMNLQRHLWRLSTHQVLECAGVQWGTKKTGSAGEVKKKKKLWKPKNRRRQDRKKLGDDIAFSDKGGSSTKPRKKRGGKTTY